MLMFINIIRSVILPLPLVALARATLATQTLFDARDSASSRLDSPGKVPIFQAPLPPPFARSKGDEIYALVTQIDRQSQWRLVDSISFGTDTEPEGLVRVGEDHYFVSHNIYTEKTVRYPVPVDGFDRTPGSGFAFIAIHDKQGRTIANIPMSEKGDLEYHNGGIDYDGRYVWTTISQYRPNSTATIYRIDPLTLQKDVVLKCDDHAGLIVSDIEAGEVLFANWGGRAFSTWTTGRRKRPTVLGDWMPKGKMHNPSHFIDYQDCKYLGSIKAQAGRRMIICGGVTEYNLSGGSSSFLLGGIAIIDFETLVPVFEFPIIDKTEAGYSLTQNPIDVDVADGRIRFYVLPDQRGPSHLLVYEVGS